MPARTKKSSAKWTPPLLRNCTGALWPRKKTLSGKIFGVMSVALRTTSFPSAGGLPAIVACRCRMEKVRSSKDKRTKYFVKRAMEAPFRMRASYNISLLHGRRHQLGEKSCRKWKGPDMCRPFFRESGVLLGSGDVEDQRASNPSASSIRIRQTIEEICDRILFFLSTVFAVGDEGRAHLILGPQILRVYPGEVGELAAGAHFFHVQPVSEYHAVGDEFIEYRLVVFFPCFA